MEVALRSDSFVLARPHPLLAFLKVKWTLSIASTVNGVLFLKFPLEFFFWLVSSPRFIPCSFYFPFFFHSEASFTQIPFPISLESPNIKTYICFCQNNFFLLPLFLPLASVDQFTPTSAISSMALPPPLDRDSPGPLSSLHSIPPYIRSFVSGRGLSFSGSHSLSHFLYLALFSPFSVCPSLSFIFGYLSAFFHGW